MRLASIRLLNWKAYRRAQINIPAGSEAQNVVVIEGNNGAGKTSILEALLFGLFGRNGLILVARAKGQEKPEQSYNGFLERALNVEGRGQATRMSVGLDFIDGEDVVGIERTWHFSAGGKHKADDEEVRLTDGPDGDLVQVPPAPEATGFVRDFVAKRLLSENLAGFFLLDGEHVERLSGHSVDDQIWGAIDAVLGAPTLRSLANDLRAYAKERRRQLPQHLTEKTRKAIQELHETEKAEKDGGARVEELVTRIAPLRLSRDEIVKKIGSLHGDSYRNFKSLFEERERLTRQRDEKRDELRRVFSGDVALALAGPALRNRAVERLAAEDRTSRWEASSAASKNRFDEFAAVLGKHGEVSTSEEILRTAWNEVWSVRPADCVEDILHRHLGDADRQAVSEHLSLLSSVRADTIGGLSKIIRELDEKIAECEREIGHQRGIDDESQALADALTAVQTQITEVESEHRLASQAHQNILQQLHSRRRDNDLLLAEGEDAAPVVARATRAERFADLVERLIDEALPANLEEISEAITLSYTEMAHKTVVREVRVEANKPVQLIDKNGENIRVVDASAGESQVFALAVMSALAGIAGDFPIVMDTPLARLDILHRRNVLNHFAGGSRQLILLTHPAELGEREMQILRPRLAGVIKIGIEPDETRRAAQ